MKFLKKPNKNKNKNILRGAILVGTMVATAIGANLVAHAAEAINNKKLPTDDYNTITLPANEIKNEEDLIKAVKEEGTQVVVDDNTGDMYVAFINEDQDVELSDITGDELGELIDTVNLITTGEIDINDIIE